MANVERATGTADKNYDIVSVLYHSLQAAEICEQYISDAERENDPEVKQFLQEAQQQNRKCAEQAKQILQKRLS